MELQKSKAWIESVKVSFSVLRRSFRRFTTATCVLLSFTYEHTRM